MKKLKLSLLAIVAAMSSSAFAGSTSANFQVNATVQPTCVITATNVDFGAITPAATGSVPSTGTVTTTCTKTTAYTLTLSSGSGSITSRKMSGATAGNLDGLLYNIYKDSGRTIVFGDGTSGQTITGLGTGVAETTTIYGSVDLNQYIRPDTYSDSLTVTLTY